jgi:hypothetical protein
MARTEMDDVKAAIALLFASLVEVAEEAGDEQFRDRFKRSIDAAYSKVRDGGPGAAKCDLETISWTRELVTGFNWKDGQQNPFLKR